MKAPERFHDFPGFLAGCPMDDTSSSARLWATNARSGGFLSKAPNSSQWAWKRASRTSILRVSQDGRRMAFVMGDDNVRPLEVWVMEKLSAVTGNCVG